MNKILANLIALKSNDEILEYKTCKVSGEEFPIYRKDVELLEKISLVIAGKKYIYDLPNYSPKVRMMMRLAFRNERKFYNIEVNGNKIISTIHPDMGKNIIKKDEFFDKDFSKENIEETGDFLTDLNILYHKVPYLDRLVIGGENSPYINQELNPKNCHLIAGGMDNQDSMYSTFLSFSQDMIDCYSCSENSNNCYESIRIFNSSKIFFSQHVKDSYNVYFSKDTLSSRNIIFGYNQTNAEYIYKDKQYLKDEWLEIYDKFKKKLKTYTGFLELKREYSDFLKSKLFRGQLSTMSENIVGATIMSSNNIFYSTSINNSEDVRYGNILIDVKDSMDVESYWKGEKLYNVSSGTNNQNMCGVTTHCWGTYNTLYSYFTDGGSNNFGCFGLKNKDYHFLNKPYSKKEWEDKVLKTIIDLKSKGKWGEFFKMNMSPFPYNDTVAMEYFPPYKIAIVDGNKVLSEKVISENGKGTIYILEKDKFISKAIFDLGGDEKIDIFYRTKEQEINIPKGMNILFSKDIPDSIDDIDESILEKAVVCDISKRPFRITKKELEFYKKHGLTIPRIHYDERHLNRLKYLPNRELDIVKCEFCKEESLSNYPGRKNVCEKCYDRL